MCEKIPTVKVEFKHLPDFILTEEDYKVMGKWKGFLKANSINPLDVKKVHHILMKPEDYPTSAWEG